MLNFCGEITFISRAIRIQAKGSANYESPCSCGISIAASLKVSWGRSKTTAVCQAVLWWGTSSRPWCVQPWTTANVTTSRCSRVQPLRRRLSTVGDRTTWADVCEASVGSAWRCRPAARRRDVPVSQTPRRTCNGAADTRRPPLCVTSTARHS